MWKGGFHRTLYFSSNKLQKLFSVRLYQSLTSLWRNLVHSSVHWGLPHLFMHSSLKGPPQHPRLLPCSVIHFGQSFSCWTVGLTFSLRTPDSVKVPGSCGCTTNPNHQALITVWTVRISCLCITAKRLHFGPKNIFPKVFSFVEMQLCKPKLFCPF